MLVARVWGGGNGELVFKGYRVSVWEDGNVREMDGGYGYPAIRIYLMPLNCTLKNDLNVKFHVMLYFTKIKNKLKKDKSFKF